MNTDEEQQEKMLLTSNSETAKLFKNGNISFAIRWCKQKKEEFSFQVVVIEVYEKNHLDKKKLFSSDVSA